MKKILSLITISFLLMFIAGCTIVHNPAPAPASTQTVDVKKENKQEEKENKRTARPRMKNKTASQKSTKAKTVAVNNKPVVQKDNKAKAVITKTPKPVVSIYKLKVTLTDIQCLDARDGNDESDDYGLQQYVVYKTLGKDKKYASRNINKFPNRIDFAGQVPGIINPLIKGDSKNQIHAQENYDMNMRNRNMISNSLIFHVTPNELKDPDASFKIFTWLKEYSYTNYLIKNVNDDKVLLNNTSVNVRINDVINILLGRKKLNENTNIPAEDVGERFKFHNFGAGYMHLANIQKIEPMVLEGPIYFVNPETIVAVWVQFELVK